MAAVAAAEDLVEAFVRESPGWLAALRQQAWERFRSIPYPTGREELWRYTDLRLLRPELYRPLGPRAPGGLGELPGRARRTLELTGTTSAGLAVHADGALVSLALGEEAAAAGVVYTDLERAVVEHDGVLRPRLGTLVGPDDPFRALAGALHRGGVFLHVPAGVQLSTPVQALHWVTAAGAALFPRTVVVVEAGASVVFNDLYGSEALGEPTLFCPVTEVFVGAGAEVGWVTWQDHRPGVRHLANVKAHLEQDARLHTLLVTLGADFSRTWKECVLAGAGSESVMLGLYFAHGSQAFEHWTVQDHVAPNTRSDLLYKGAVADTARSVYYGTIRVRPQARRTDAYQANRNLTLSPRAVAHTNPQLEIANNDVRCTHGATVGRVDPEQLFYLMTRGIPRPEAERLVVFGFFKEVLDRVAWSGMHERLAEAIQAKVEAQASEEDAA